MNRTPTLNERAFTLLELMVVVAIVAVLCLLSASLYPKIVNRAENAKCVDRMKNLHVALANFVGTRQTWPQMPESMDGADEEQYWEWWAKTLKPYGAPEREWLCPTDDRLRKADFAKEGRKRDLYEGTYAPTNFEEGADIPYKWQQPWLIEHTDFHANGRNVIFPDGSVRSWKTK
jgi:prepilin-type N-terminal cleavage/methylation domain-containing protein/prepilin-type processing-associated H-X9-DG protein